MAEGVSAIASRQITKQALRLDYHHIESVRIHPHRIQNQRPRFKTDSRLEGGE
jgi:hypothetical protein